MMLFIINEIEKIIKKYTPKYMLQNRSKDLAVGFICIIDEHNKEFLLNDLDINLPYGFTFSHTYENGKLDLTIKELI